MVLLMHLSCSICFYLIHEVERQHLPVFSTVYFKHKHPVRLYTESSVSFVERSDTSLTLNIQFSYILLQYFFIGNLLPLQAQTTMLQLLQSADDFHTPW